MNKPTMREMEAAETIAEVATTLAALELAVSDSPEAEAEKWLFVEHLREELADALDSLSVEAVDSAEETSAWVN